MARPKRGTIPGYRRHKQSGQAYVNLSGRQVLLGPHGSPASWRAYHRAVAEWQANGRRVPDKGAGDYLVRDLVAEYLEHAEVYYRRKDGSPTSEVENTAGSMVELLHLYGDVPAADFGLAQLRVVREAMIARPPELLAKAPRRTRDKRPRRPMLAGLSRANTNQRIGRIVRMFRWASVEEKVPEDVFGKLRALSPLKAHHSKARETEPKKPVDWKDVEAVLPRVPRQVRAMILLQWHCAMRPSEVCSMKPCEIDRKATPWRYRPAQHKTSWRGRSRVVPFGPRAREVLAPFLDRVPRPAPDAPLFRPMDAHRERREGRVPKEKKRKRRPVTPHDVARVAALEREAAKRRRVPGEAYDVRGYAQAIARACDEAEVARWSPGRLRHSAATRLQAELGIEEARCVLGHSTAQVTMVYAQADELRAAAALERLG